MEKIKYSNKTIEAAKDLSDACINCKLCVKECQMLQKHKAAPKEYFKKVADGEELRYEVPFSCTFCGCCTEVCPKKLRLQDVFRGMRKDIIVQNKGKSPMKGHSAIEVHQTLGFSKLFNTAIEDKAAGFTKRVFVPGCSLPSYNPGLVDKTLGFLQEKLLGTGAVLKCCGKPTLDLGQGEKFKERYAEFDAAVRSLGADEIITACQNCYKVISKYSPDLKVKSLWTVIAELGLDRDMKGKGKSSDLIFSIHDACPTRFDSDIQDGVRAIVKDLGYEVKESSRSREKTRCCGFGGMVFPADPELGKTVMKETANSSESEYVISYCASCREAMARGGKKSVHLLDLMFSDTYDSESEFAAPSKTSLENWTKRYKSKRNILKYKKIK